MEVHVVTPERELWSGDATLVVARGTEGEVGIQRGHAPLLIRLDVGVLRVRGEQDFRAVIDGGFMHVTTGPEVTRVDVLADHAELEDEVDFAAAEQARADAERRLGDSDDASAEADLRKARVRLGLRA